MAPTAAPGTGDVPPQMGNQLCHILYAENRQSIGKRGLGSVGGGHIQLPDPAAGGKHGHGQHTGYGAERPRQAQLTQKSGVFRQGADLPRRRHQPQQNGQVVHRSLFPHPGRRQIHGNTADGKLGAAVFYRRTHPLP